MAKAFHFSLKRIQQFKEQILESEKSKLSMLNRERLELVNRKRTLLSFLEDKERELRERSADGTLTASVLSGLRFYRENTMNQIQDTDREIEQLDIKIEEQKQRVILASQELQGLDKLEEKQLEEYKKSEAKDFENQIAEGLVNKLSGAASAH